MARHRLEVADIVRAHRIDLERDRGNLTLGEQRVLTDIANCRTRALGGHLERCDQCGHETIAYDSCRNRHCPKCLNGAREEWLRERAAELLPIEYYHVVFTVPHELNRLARQNKQRIYELLFRTAAESLTTIAADPKHLGAEIGVLAILHTWGQNLEHHPHVHCVVTGGGISPDGNRWVSCRPGFFLPVRVLSRYFQGRFLAALRRTYERGELVFHGGITELAEPARFKAMLDGLYRKDWAVYAKAPFGGPERVLRYLGRYTHRVAISNQRLVSMADGRVSFLWKDYAHGSRRGVMTLSAVEFLRRFLLHVLPLGFVRIRHYGLLANCHRKKKLDLCRGLLATPPPLIDSTKWDTAAPQCPSCGERSIRIILRFEAGERLPIAKTAGPSDTS